MAASMDREGEGDGGGADGGVGFNFNRREGHAMGHPKRIRKLRSVGLASIFPGNYFSA